MIYICFTRMIRNILHFMAVVKQLVSLLARQFVHAISMVAIRGGVSLATTHCHFVNHISITFGIYPQICESKYHINHLPIFIFTISSSLMGFLWTLFMKCPIPVSLFGTKSTPLLQGPINLYIMQWKHRTNADASCATSILKLNLLIDYFILKMSLIKLTAKSQVSPKKF